MHFKSYVELGEIYNIVILGNFKNHINEMYINEILLNSSERINQIVVIESFKKRQQQLLHIVSIGDRFNEDEILLLLTMRFELSLVNKILQLNNIKIENYNSDDIDEKIDKIKNNKKNLKSFNIALNLMNKNWEVAMMDSPW